MARPLRIEFEGALYHVMSRGNERRPIVRDDADRTKRIDWLRRTVETYGWRLHAFALMPNHDHLFVETPRPNLSSGMQYFNGSYTGYFNHRHRRAGHLFQGRFKGHLIEEEGYFLEVSRYIHLNPVRAKLVDRPEEYSWSSYPGYQRSRSALDWITYGRVLGEFGATAAQARRAYTSFVRSAVEEPPDSPFSKAVGGLLLGSKKFTDRMRRQLAGHLPDTDIPQLEMVRPRPPLEIILKEVTHHFAHPTTWLPGTRSNDAGRAVAAYLARRRFGYKATAVAKSLGYSSPSSVSHAVRRIENGSDELRKAVTKIHKKLQ